MWNVKNKHYSSRFVRVILAVSGHANVSHFGRNLAGSPQEPVYARTYNENAAGPELENTAAQTLSEPAQSQCTWASHKSHFCAGSEAYVLCEFGQSKCR